VEARYAAASDTLSRRPRPASGDLRSIYLPVRGCFCFVDTELPLLGTPTINGLSIFGRRGLPKELHMAGELSAERALMVAAAIGERFPVA
jgi:hypothetical protein